MYDKLEIKKYLLQATNIGRNGAQEKFLFDLRMEQSM